MAVVLGALAGVLTKKLGDLAEQNIGQVLGVKKELNTLKDKMQWIEIRLQKRSRDELSKLYEDKLTDWMYDAEDIIELCGMEGSKLLEERYEPSSSLAVCNPSMAFSCFGSVPFRYKIASKLKDLNARLDQITKNKSQFDEISKLESKPSRVINQTTSSYAPDEFVGSEIENDTQELVKIINKGNNKGVLVVAICGMGGIGKTTLAKKLYNDPQIVNAFQKKLWIFISPNCTDVDVLKRTIENITGKRPESDIKEILETTLIREIEGKNLFLVLDDVWNGNIWKNALETPLDKAARGVVLVTTRDGHVARNMKAIHTKSVEQLKPESGFELLCRSADLTDADDVDRLRDIGKKIVGKCKGLPLAIKVMGGLLLGKEHEWEMVLNSDTWMREKEFEGPLLLSYEYLSPQLQQCFLYCSLFPKGNMYRWDLVRLWLAEGFIQEQGDVFKEEVAKNYYFELIRRNMLQVDSNYFDPVACTMHDLLRSLAHSLTENQSFCCDPKKLLIPDISKFRRLSIIGGDEAVTVPTPNNEKLRLRSLLLFQSPPNVKFHMFERLESLRVLILNGGGVDTIPESLEKLIFLRMLDLDQTCINKIPESIGSLINLEILNLQGCKCLESLPKGLTKLCNLRRLGLRGTPLKSVPRGIGGLKLLNDLEGFIVASNSSGEPENDGWDLKELEPLTNLRYLLIEKLESQVYDVQLLNGKPHMIKLELYCTPLDERGHEKTFSEVELYNMEKIFQNMSPPLCLKELYMRFFGREYPKWIEDLSHLTELCLLDCINFSVLPPLGQLPNLKLLFIENANGVRSVGSEFLGNEEVAFPKLELFRIKRMPNWEYWSLTTERIEQRDVADGGVVGKSRLLSLFPRLKQLTIEDCHKLSALPKELNQASNLEELLIERAESLKVVENLPSISGMKINECHSLEKVSNLLLLKELYILECPTLRCIENMDCLQLLCIDSDMDSLPKGLSEIANARQNLDDANTKLILYCRLELFLRCLEGAEDWSVIQHFSSANINVYYEGTRIFIEYNRLKQTYETNFWDAVHSRL